MKNGDVTNFLRAKLLALEMEIKNDVSGPVVASFGFIIALVWRDAIKGAIDEFLLRAGLVSEAYIYNFVSAVFVTVFVIAIMIAVTRFGRARKEVWLNENIEKISKELSK